MNRHNPIVNALRSQLNSQLENQQLASLRDWLLPMLMNGQVTSTGSVTENSTGSVTGEVVHSSDDSKSSDELADSMQHQSPDRNLERIA